METPSPPAPPGGSNHRDPLDLARRLARASIPPAAPPVRPTRWWLHLLLAVLTLYTMARYGTQFWTGPADLEAAGPGRLERLLAQLAWGMPYALWTFAILLAHELGHYLACRYYRIPATPPFFLPVPLGLGTFGAVIRIRGRIPDRRSLFDVAAAGPIAGFVVAVPAMVLGLLRAEPFTPLEEVGGITFEFGKSGLRLLLGDWLATPESITVNAYYGAAWVGMLVTSLNLFPMGQLDGGHIVYALAPRRLTAVSWLSIAGLVGLVAYQLAQRQFPVYALWLVIGLWMRGRHPRLADESVGLGTGRKLIALSLLLIFALSIMVMPITVTIHD